jgi:hypothetical protein
METDLLDEDEGGGIEVNEADKEAFIAASKPDLRGVRHQSMAART